MSVQSASVELPGRLGGVIAAILVAVLLAAPAAWADETTTDGETAPAVEAVQQSPADNGDAADAGGAADADVAQADAAAQEVSEPETDASSDPAANGPAATGQPEAPCAPEADAPAEPQPAAEETAPQEPAEPEGQAAASESEPQHATSDDSMQTDPQEAAAVNQEAASAQLEPSAESVSQAEDEVPSASAAPVKTTQAAQPAKAAAKTATPAKRVAAKASATDAAATSTASTAKAESTKAEAAKEDPARTVADGVYYIASYATPKQAIAIADGAKKAGTAASLSAKAKGITWQKWQFIWKDGSYEIVNVATGKALAVASKKAGAKVVQAKRADTKAQRWSITLSKDGKYATIKNLQSGAVLNISGKAKAGTGITAAAAAKKAAQRFTLAKANLIDAGSYLLLSGLNKKMAIAASSAKKGAQAALAKKSGKALGQRFYVRNEAGGMYSIQSAASGMFLADVKGKAVWLPWDAKDKALLWSGSYASGVKFLNASTGKSLAISGGKAVAKAKLSTAKPASGKSQLWTFASKGLLPKGTYTIQNAAGGYLEVKGASYKKNANVRTAAKESAAGSTCFELQVLDGGLYRIVNTKTYQAVAVKSSSKKAGANVVQRVEAAKKGQQWKASIDRDGNFTFTNARSGMVLQKSGKKGNATQGTANGAKSQSWSVAPVERYSTSGNKKLDKNIATILRDHGSLGDVWSYVVNFSYREGKRFYGGSHYLSNATTISYANDMYAHHSGNCYRFASLFSWLARGLGYSTKVVSGWVPAAVGGKAPHGWVEVYRNGSTLVCDPDLRHEMPGHNWYMTTYASAPITYGSW